MRLLVAGWQSQIAHAVIEVAPGRADIEACAIGRPGLDICEVRTIERALNEIRPDIIINTAAYTDVDKAELEPQRALALNRDGARLLAESAARRDIPIIHISTDYVFSGMSAVPYVETDATAPATLYGRSKLEGEAAIQAANPKHIIVRTAWVYSPFGRNFVKTTLQRARKGETLRIVADQFGSPTYAPHLVEVILGIAARATRSGNGAVPWGVYHAAGNGRASWHEIAKQALVNAGDVRHLADRVEAIASADYPTRTQRPAMAALDCAKLEANFGLRLPDWSEGIAACVARLGV
jgi:dTDP-4-dehydrorhamnose reductase